MILLPQKRNKFPEKLDFRTSVGHLDGGRSREELGAPGRGPERVITNLGVYGFDGESREMVLEAIHPGVALEEVKAEVSWPLRVKEPLATTALPDSKTLALLAGGARSPRDLSRMKDESNLRIPGPTPMPPEVREALSRQMSNYRGQEMKVLVSGLYEKFSRYLETTHELVLLTASGTGGLEAAVANVLSPGDRVLGVSAGVFGERFCSIAAELGCDVKRLPVEWGKSVDPEASSVMRSGRRKT